MKKMLWGLAASALVLSSCSTNEVDDIVSGNDNPNVINFMTSTTKASINTITNVQAGFTVYAANRTAANPKWQFEAKKYLFSNGSWGFDGGTVAWPGAEAGAYPLSFYAFFPQTFAGFTPNSTTTVGTLTAAITVQTPTHAVDDTNDVGSVTTNQADFLAANNTVAAKPVGGYVSLTFGHIMSKINAAVVPGYNTNVYVQAVKFQGSKTTNTFTYNSNEWTSTLATVAEMQYANKAGAAYKVTATDKSFNFTGTDATETTAFPFYTMATPPVAGPNGHATNHGSNLMLLPQDLSTVAWNPTVENATTPTNEQAYIEVIYRVTDNIGKDLVGVTAASTTSIPGWDGTPGMVADRPLFVRVGFPLPTKWEQGKGYMYKIMLGTVAGTGGYYLDDTYYDENGNDTFIQIKDGGGEEVEPGDPVNKGTIDFIVDVTGWDDQTPETIQ